MKLYVDLGLIKKGSKVKFTSTNDSIVLKESTIAVPGRMRSTSKVARIEVVIQGREKDASGIIEARVANYFAQCRVDVKERVSPPPSGVSGLFKDWDFDHRLSKNQQSALDTIEGSPTQGYILINSSHPINRRYFGEKPEKAKALLSHKSSLYVAELILNEALGRMISDAYQKDVIPKNHGPAIDIPFYIAERKLVMGDKIYDGFVFAELSGLEARRVNRLEEAKQKTEMTETELLENMEDRPRTMVEMYFGLGEQSRHTLEEIGTRFKITRERVRQIVNKALARNHAEKEGTEDVAYSEEADTRDYILEEGNRLKSEAERVVAVSAKMYATTPEKLYEHSRRANVVVPRQIAMYLLRNDIGLSFPSIGRQFNRDHTTVIHSCNKVKEMVGKNAKIRNRIEKVRKLLSSV